MITSVIKRQTVLAEPLPADGETYSVLIAVNPDVGNGPSLDIEGLVLDQYVRNPVVLWVHDSWTIPIARTLNLTRQDGKLRAEFEFLTGDEFAERVRNAWDKGFLRAASIGWEHDEGSGRDVMLEWSIVPIPADSDALRATHKRMIESLIPDSAFEKEDNGMAATETTTATDESPQGHQGQLIDDLAGRFNDALMGVAVAEKVRQSMTTEAPASQAPPVNTPPAPPTETTEEKRDAAPAVLTMEDVQKAVNDVLDARAKAETETEKDAEEKDSDASFRSAVARRAEIISRAQPFLPEGFDPHRESDEAILRAVLGERAHKGASEEYMRGMLMGMEAPKEDQPSGETEADGDDGSAGRQRSEAQRQRVSEDASGAAKPQQDGGEPSKSFIEVGRAHVPEVKRSHEGYVKYLLNAWKGDSDKEDK